MTFETREAALDYARAHGIDALVLGAEDARG
jgi:hypothetical protein